MKRYNWLLAGLVASAALAAVAWYERSLAVAACGGEYIYPIDDTYIHIAMAKCLALDGTWGVEPGKMAFCSSSPLWTLLLAGLYRLGGVSEPLPWFLALGFNIGMVFVVCRFLSYLGGGVFWQLFGAGCVAVAGPSLCTTALGMEHAMHACFVMATLAASVGAARGERKCRMLAPLLAAAATASRYETLFLLLPAGILLCILEAYDRHARREGVAPVRGLVFLAAAIMPVVAYGTWALWCGGHFFPNSLLLKGGFHSPSELFEKIILLAGTIKPGCGFLYLLAASLVGVVAFPRVVLIWKLLAMSVVIAIGGQLVFADVGQLCRYEAYLTATGVFVLLAAVLDSGFGEFPRSLIPIGVVSVTMLVFAARARTSFAEAVRSSFDIFHQQVLMTRILSTLPEESRGCVALNDLGYMALHGNFPFLDIWGLGSQDATELILQNEKRWTQEANEILFGRHGVRYVVVFDKWFPQSRMPEGTVDVATMTSHGNQTCGSDTVSFRATSGEYAEKLERHLMKYADNLPPGVTMRFCR